MEESPKQSTTPLRQVSSTLSDSSFGSNSTVVASPASPASYRPGYRRVPSAIEEDEPEGTACISTPSSKERHGLGIDNIEKLGDQKIARPSRKACPVGANPADALLSPSSTKAGSDIGFGGKVANSREDDQYADNASTVQLLQPSTTNGSKFPLGFENRASTCRSKGPLSHGRSSWVGVAILILSTYSTAFSALWLTIAIVRPRYGHAISLVGKVTPTAASTLYTAFAKSIELSFVTVFVSLLGQILSKRALGERKSITIAEMSMRSWVLQPGTMITHWQSVRYAVVTRLGIFAVLGAITAMLYTTASDALVAPQLQLGRSESRLIFGKVSTKFANVKWIEDQCPTPIQVVNDPDNVGETCIEMQHAGDAYHNYLQYLELWSASIATGNGSTDLKKRSEPVALSENFTRTVNNITVAMPHSGVIAAAIDPLNSIMQPHDTSGLGEYYVNASVPSPVANVLCASLTAEELTPMVYYEWLENYRNDTGMPNSTSWPNYYDLTIPEKYRLTAVDKLFDFDESQVHPIFPKLPDPYNTVLNASSAYGPNSVYLLAATQDKAYTMCSIRAAVTPSCSTHYHVTVSGAALSVNCEDPEDRLAYRKSVPEAPNGVWEKDWKDVASGWASALSLNAGISDGKASNARLLSQMIPKANRLDPALPSISEALAVLAGNTLLLSSLNSPFIHYWNYSNETPPILKTPQYQAFNATFRSIEYQSGGTQDWQGMFYIVLAVVFIANLCCFIYFLVSGGLMTDFIEPQNLFSLALLSPPSEDLAGACGGGPDRNQYDVPWNVKIDRAREHLWFESSDGKRSIKRRHKRNKSSISGPMEYEMQQRPLLRAYSKIRRNRASIL
ncbi:hypothetical protein ACLMJK_002577 [Lecanora helva]